MKIRRLLRSIYSAFFALVMTCFVNFHVHASEDSLEDIAEETGLADSTGYGKGVSIVDVDGDGWEDIWDLNTNILRGKDRPSNSKLYLNQRDGTFKAVETGVDPLDVQFAWGAAWADFDNDGDPDLVVASGGLLRNGNLALYENRWKEKERVENISISAGITAEKHAWWGASWADFNNDGCLDFVAVDRAGRAWLYRNDCDKTFTEVAAKLGITVEFKDGKNPVWLDFDDDGDQDLYIAGSKHHRLYRNDGDRGFSDVTEKLKKSLMDTPLVFAAFASDLNHDGSIDLYLGRQARQDLIAFGQSDGTFKIAGSDVGIVTKLAPNRSENTMGLGAGDINDDGYVDILIGTGGPRDQLHDIVFCGEKKPDSPFGVAFKRCGNFARTGHGKKQTHGIAVGDLDQDGSNEVFYNLGGAPPFDLRNGTDSRAFNALYSRKAANEKTAAISLRGVDSNRDAIGARIKVTVSPGNQFHYEIRSAQGFQSENSRWQLVNLMNEERASIEIRWPSGRMTTHTVEAGDRTTIQER
jgi:hypothetical protein